MQKEKENELELKHLSQKVEIWAVNSLIWCDISICIEFLDRE